MLATHIELQRYVDSLAQRQPGLRSNIDYIARVINNKCTASITVFGQRFSLQEVFLQEDQARTAVAAFALNTLKAYEQKGIDFRQLPPSEHVSNSLLQKVEAWLRAALDSRERDEDEKTYTTLLCDLLKMLHMSPPKFEIIQDYSEIYSSADAPFMATLYVGSLTFRSSKSFPDLQSAKDSCAVQAINAIVQGCCGIHPSIASAGIDTNDFISVPILSRERPSHNTANAISSRNRNTNNNSNSNSNGANRPPVTGTNAAPLFKSEVVVLSEVVNKMKWTMDCEFVSQSIGKTPGFRCIMTIDRSNTKQPPIVIDSPLIYGKKTKSKTASAYKVLARLLQEGYQFTNEQLSFMRQYEEEVPL
ncbi:uncharacterized protein BYT42DRAFT_558013 [Radiomyces spectabilis]|uniref:uncharacterized protein n=1 Tax=Radiomyces spectabilis TaxID=64574 RepID=UPI00221EBB68|nr:uncharacterized protein BYT42DRAFT_558013 [Radiomyces spectabilis]KAI8391765.1 hypothetical protein BYT42DRAFT_558013 [Radiomyces spectabilis]